MNQVVSSPGRRFLRVLHLLEDGLLVAVLAGMILLAVIQIVLRNLAGGGLLWGDALLRLMVLWLGVLGAAAATREDRQISIDVLSRFLSPRFRAASRLLTSLFTAAVCSVLAWHGWRLVAMDREAAITAFASVPAWLCQLVIPVGFGLIALRSLVRVFGHARRLGTGEPAP